MAVDRRLALAVSRLPGHRGWRKRRILDLCRDERDLAALLADDASARRSGSPGSSELLRAADAELAVLGRSGIGFAVLGEEAYPAALAAIHDPPLVLYHRGPLPPADRPSVAVVGTRRPTAGGLRAAYRLGAEFALSDVPVLSGLAYGIDRAAHEGALAGGGPTWAVLAGGLDRPGPLAHRALAAAILDAGGGLVGEMPPGSWPERFAFPRRNRILSGLCRGTVVVQAPARSGALITADFALEQGRDLFVSPAGLDGPSSAGTRALEGQGAPLARGADDVLGEWGRVIGRGCLSAVPAPMDPPALSQSMRAELDGRLLRYKGEVYECRRG